MAQYIDKKALVAKIERTIDEPYPKHDQQCDWEDGYCGGLYKALSIIEDTLEVKEVDLEKEIDTYLSIWYQQVINSNPQLITIHDCKRIAKHFFELGLKTKVE